MARVGLHAFAGGPFTNEYYAFGGTVSTQTSTVRSGVRSALRCNPTTTAVGYATLGIPAAIGTITDIGENTAYLCVYFRYATKPSSNYEEFIVVEGASGTTVKMILALNSSGNIAVYDKDIALVATGSTALSANTWYRIEVKAGNGTSAAYEVRIDGTTELSGNCNQLASAINAFTVGKRTNRNGNTVDFFYSEAVIDNADFPGAIKIVQLVPRANGSTMEWTSGTGASNYTQVDECPADVADYVMSPATANKLALFVFDSTSTAGIVGTINAVALCVNGIRENTTVTSSDKIRMKSGATNADTTAANINTTDNGRILLRTTDPNTGSAWTSSAVDALEGGAIEANAVSIRMAQVFIAVEYTPGVDRSVTGSGGADLSGDATATMALTHTPSGTATTSGAGTAAMGLAATGSGGLDTSGAATTSAGFSFTGSGGITIDGEVSAVDEIAEPVLEEETLTAQQLMRTHWQRIPSARMPRSGKKRKARPAYNGRYVGQATTTILAASSYSMTLGHQADGGKARAIVSGEITASIRSIIDDGEISEIIRLIEGDLSHA